MTIKLTISSDRDNIKIKEIVKIQNIIKEVLNDPNVNVIWDNINGTLEV